MTALQITSMKHFMKCLLLSESFDDFLLQEAVVAVGCTVTIDGRVNKAFYRQNNDADSPALPEFRPFSELRGLCFDLIKGKQTPLFFRFTMQLKPEKVAALLTEENCQVPSEQVKAFALNIRYDGAKTILTTATALQTFLPSKEPDAIWDRALKSFLDSEGIEYEIL